MRRGFGHEPRVQLSLRRNQVSDRHDELAGQRDAIAARLPVPGTTTRHAVLHARVSTTQQSLARQIDALRAVDQEHIYVDKRTGTHMDGVGVAILLGFARPGGPVQPTHPDPLGRNMLETLNLAHDLTSRGIVPRTRGDTLAVDTSDPGNGMAIALLVMFAQMERIYMLECAAIAHAAKEARRLPTEGPPS